jgi:hypothetical protein
MVRLVRITGTPSNTSLMTAKRGVTSKPPWIMTGGLKNIVLDKWRIPATRPKNTATHSNT